jgi:hypothetical protein
VSSEPKKITRGQVQRALRAQGEAHPPGLSREDEILVEIYLAVLKQDLGASERLDLDEDS